MPLDIWFYLQYVLLLSNTTNAKFFLFVFHSTTLLAHKRNNKYIKAI